MNRIILFLIMAWVLGGCSDKNNYENAVLEQMKVEKDIQDYKIDPELMTDCVVNMTSQNMPGLFSMDPLRIAAYQNYTEMLLIGKSNDPKKAIEMLREKFGSAKGLVDARANYTESVVECMSTIATGMEEKEK